MFHESSWNMHAPDPRPTVREALQALITDPARRDHLWAAMRGDPANLDADTFAVACAYASTVPAVEDFGLLGLDTEAAARFATVIAAADQDYAGPWPPTPWRSNLPGDLAEIAEVIAERAGNNLKMRVMAEWDDDAWFAYLPALLANDDVPTVAPGPVTAAMAADDRMRRTYADALEAAVDWWAHDGPAETPTDHLWSLLTHADDPVEEFIASRGELIWADPTGRAESELRGAYLRLRDEPNPVGTGMVRLANVCALRVALEGNLRFELAFVDTSIDRHRLVDALTFARIAARSAAS